LEVKKQQRVEQSQRSKRAIEFFVDRLGLSLVKSKGKEAPQNEKKIAEKDTM